MLPAPAYTQHGTNYPGGSDLFLLWEIPGGDWAQADNFTRAAKTYSDHLSHKPDVTFDFR